MTTCTVKRNPVQQPSNTILPLQSMFFLLCFFPLPFNNFLFVHPADIHGIDTRSRAKVGKTSFRVIARLLHRIAVCWWGMSTYHQVFNTAVLGKRSLHVLVTWSCSCELLLWSRYLAARRPSVPTPPKTVWPASLWCMKLHSAWRRWIKCFWLENFTLFRVGNKLNS